MTDEDEGPRTVHLNPAELPGGERFRAPVIPVVEPLPRQPATLEPPAAAQATRAVRIPDRLTQAFAAPPAPAPAAQAMPTSVAQAMAGPAAQAGPNPNAWVRSPAETPERPAEHPTPGGEPLGPRPPVIRQPRSDRTAVYTSTPRPAGKATVPVPGSAAAAPVSAPPQARPAWTVEPGWSAYPQQAPASGPARPSPLAGALLGTGTGAEAEAAKTSSTRRTVLTVVAVIVIAALVGGGVAWYFGDAIGNLISKVTG
jgi:hypothetical protein